MPKKQKPPVTTLWALALPKYWLLSLGLAVIWLLSLLPYPIICRITRGIGWLTYYAVPRRRKIIQKNIALCFPQLPTAEQHNMVKRIHRATGQTLADMAASWWFSDKRFNRLFQIKGLENLDNALEQGHGAILCSAHMMCLEPAGRYLAQFRRSYFMYRPHGNPAFDYVQRLRRDHYTAGTIHRSDIRTCIRVLRGGNSIWYAPDQDYGRKVSTFAPLFGVQAASITATGKLAKLSKSPIVPFLFYRRPNDQGYQIELWEALENFPTGDEVADATRINQLIEAMIMTAPEQYLWAHRRFKTRPPGEAKFY
jgi:KDO2-lipid IV(A) lauroyltransferase